MSASGESARTSLGSAPPPPVSAADHVRGEGPEVVVYFDLACPRCAGIWAQITVLPVRLCVRHFPVASKRPRSPALHAAAEAVARQSEEAFWPFWDGLLADRARVDDPHLWERATRLGLELADFDRDRRSAAVGERIRRDFASGIRAGVTGTPAAFVDGELLAGELVEAMAELGPG